MSSIPLAGNSTEDFMARVEAMRGAALTDDERLEIDLWIKGRALRQITDTEGWEIAMSTLKTYPENAAYTLMRRDPKHKEDVLADHAVAFAASRIYNDFVNTVKLAIDASQKTPNCVRTALKNSPAPVPGE